ncbi:hypothetical protein EYF80_041465 [Liparis tanakae]|uniref:Immunoglobulin V-set domain-containing protein n=1 Tax=Liparis tanakae TaxID=230148 RepID=A0A4Z2G442_9TELE|nr:hypothetical protein EYF80_041465 [Liparis tanakae]
MSLALYRGFPAEEKVVFLSLDSGRVTSETPAVEFAGRIRVAQRAGPALGFTLQLSLLGPRDTNLYYCLWWFFNLETSSTESLRSAGTVIVVRERDPQELCKDQVFDRILIALSAAAFSIVVGLCIAALVVKRKQFKRSFRPARGATPPARPNRPAQAAPRDDPYLFTYVNSLDVSAIVEC